MVGGSSDPSVPWSPGVTLQEKAGRPMGPSTLRCEYLWEVVVVYVGLLFWLCSFLFVLCEAVVISQGSVFVLGPLSPSRPDPCLFFNCLSSSFFSLSGAFVDAVTLSLSLSLSGAGETQTFLVWVSRCVSSTCTRSPTSIRTSSPTPTPRPCPAPVFFSFFRRRHSFAGLVFFSCCWSCRCWLSWWVFLSLVLVLVGLLHCIIDLGSFGRGRETRHLPPL